ncbi:MAG: HNH endonuclease [Trueperaceae bacterium]|nr:HNH endonuclease [Trueperaceae bacterium]
MERPLLGHFVAGPAAQHGFSIGAVYNRRQEIHDRFGGQRQYGISTPRKFPYVFLFTNRQGLQHGYHDYFDDGGFFHYYGEGRVDDMRMDGGNEAIRTHLRDGRHLLVFLGLGDGLYRYLGEFVHDGSYIDPHASDTAGQQRKAIVFRLRPLEDEPPRDDFVPLLPPDGLVGATQRESIAAVRTKQALFRRRVSLVEKECRLTSVMDLRFLRASHIKPWSQSNDAERVDEYNGLLLTPSADLLFDHGWVSFHDDGRLVVAEGLPERVKDHLGFDLRQGRRCGAFSPEQGAYLAHHRDCVFGRKEFQEQLASALID